MLAQDDSCGGGTKRDGKGTLQGEQKKLLRSDEYVHYLNFDNVFIFYTYIKIKLCILSIYDLL